MVAGGAIARHGAQVERAFLLDPAIPAEAFLPADAIANDTCMEPDFMRPYPEDIKSSEYHRLFTGTSDARKTLTWRGLLHAAVPKLTVFYSPGEEVLTAFPEDLPADPGFAGDDPRGKYAFALQALLKGRLGAEPDTFQEQIVGKFTSFMTHAFEGFSPATDWGGWCLGYGDELPQYVLPPDFNNLELMERFRPPEWFAAQLADPAFRARLKRDPIFTALTHPACAGLFGDATGSAVAADANHFNTILAQMVPERTLPAGGAGGSGVPAGTDGFSPAGVRTLEQKYALAVPGGTIATYDMQAAVQTTGNGWPAERRKGLIFGNGWRHGDVREVAYLYVWPAWQKIVDDAGIETAP